MSNSEPEILFENDDVLVVNKPVGLLVHADGVSTDTTLVDWFLERVPSAQGVGEPGKGKDGQPLERSGVVHRLDRETSGVLILAKTAEAFTHLKAQFHDRLAKKEYRAIVYGRMRERWGTIDKKIGRSPSDHRQRSAMPGARGTLREAVTDWECIGQAQIDEEHFSYLKLRPKTGRTHQLRVHLRAIDRPIVGDQLYAESLRESSHNLGLTRMALHAHILEVTLPDGTLERFIAPVPRELEAAAERIAEEG
jgi:23S rRNA pseudouridine1911/1915/1917 synthase